MVELAVTDEPGIISERLPSWREMNRDTTVEAEAILLEYCRAAPA
jgi:hypothetical protein